MKKILFFALILFSAFYLIGCSTGDTTTTQQNTVLTTRTFTIDDLKNYSGVDGSTAYVAINGIVYDVTDVFENGEHQGLQLAGTDATAFFATSPHTEDLLDTLTVVGVIVNQSANTTTEVPTTTMTPTTTMSPTTTVPVSTMPTFTLTQLSQYTGANGSTAYIAVNGIVYDVTDVFDNGKHQGLQLGGTDATAVFATSPHNLSQLDLLTVVGYLEGYNPG